MPGAARSVVRDRTDADSVGLTDADREPLGKQVLDVYLKQVL
jgi:hypothetical protein